MNPTVASLIIFILAYVSFVVFQKRRSIFAVVWASAAILAGGIGWHEALTEAVSWNVIGLFVGTLVLAELFMESRMPAVMAEWLVDRTHTARQAMVAVCLFSGLLSAFVENVAVVLLVAPVAFSLAEKLKVSPVKLIIFIALSSNLQGTATLIGDPPSMILAGHMKLSFLDFFVYQGKLGIFFAVQAGALASMLVIAWILRAYRESIDLIPVEKVKAKTPSVLLILLVVGLSVASLFDPDFKWFAGSFTLVLALAALIWYRWVAKWGSSRTLIRSLDWDTAIFLVGVFIIVGALSSSGWLDKIAMLIATHLGGNVFVTFCAIVAIAVVLSGFVDNVPFLIVMIPVVDKVAQQMGVAVPLLMFGMLVGACLGGNITPIGASANIVAMGVLRKRGHIVSFGQFMGLGIPFTIAAVLAACALVWFVWA